MNAWNINDMLTFLEVARVFGFTIRTMPSPSVPEQSIVRVMSMATGKLYGVDFDRTNGSVRSFLGDDHEDLMYQSLPTQNPAAWYAVIGITCDTTPVSMRILPDAHNCQLCATNGGHLKDGPHTFAGNCQRRRAVPG